MIQGDLYCAHKDHYLKIIRRVKNGINESLDSMGIKHAKTNELGRINEVDPLGITYFRIRGMWGIKNPLEVYEYLYKINQFNRFTLICLMTKEKYETFDQPSRIRIEKSDLLKIEDIYVKDPNNTVNLIQSKLITFSLKNKGTLL